MSVQESCFHERSPNARKLELIMLTWSFVVPGTRFEFVRTFVQGCLRPPVRVSLVPASSSSALWSAPSVRAVSLVRFNSAECSQILCTFVHLTAACPVIIGSKPISDEARRSLVRGPLITRAFVAKRRKPPRRTASEIDSDAMVWIRPQRARARPGPLPPARSR